jgi:uncharacterized protein
MAPMSLAGSRGLTHIVRSHGGAGPPALKRYFSELFGWDVRELGYDNPMNYGTVNREDNVGADGIGIGGGIGTAPEGYEGHVTFYVEVPDVEAALAGAESLGGTRLMGPDKVPDGPEIGQFADPEGHVIGVVTSAA